MSQSECFAQTQPTTPRTPIATQHIRWAKHCDFTFIVQPNIFRCNASPLPQIVENSQMSIAQSPRTTPNVDRHATNRSGSRIAISDSFHRQPKNRSLQCFSPTNPKLPTPNPQPPTYTHPILILSSALLGQIFRLTVDPRVSQNPE